MPNSLDEGVTTKIYGIRHTSVWGTPVVELQHTVKESRCYRFWQTIRASLSTNLSQLISVLVVWSVVYLLVVLSFMLGGRGRTIRIRVRLGKTYLYVIVYTKILTSSKRNHREHRIVTEDNK